MRSLLSVPASQPKMVEKALTLDCDQIILDLEDSVTPADKAAARTYLKDFLSKVESKKRISLRVNELSSAFAKADIDLICGFNPQPLSSVILPKIHNLDDVKSWAAKLPAGMQLEVQIESAMGLIQAPHIASHPQVISDFEEVEGHSFDVIYVVGGGSANDFLNQLTADVTRKKVITGAVEATLLGNIGMQAIAAGEVSGLAQLREMIAASITQKIFLPS